MKEIELDTLDARLQDRIFAAVAETILITEKKQPNPDEPEPKRRKPTEKSLHRKQESLGLGPVLVIRSLLDDDVSDDLIARHPAFLETIGRARQQKAAGRARRLEDVRQKYEASQEAG